MVNDYAATSQARNPPRTGRVDVAVLGASGSGKSTFISSLLRFSGSQDGAHSDVRVSATSEPSRASTSSGFSPTWRLQAYSSENESLHSAADLSFIEWSLNFKDELGDGECVWRLPWSVQHAPAVVLCIDSTKPQGELWWEAWPHLTSAMLTLTGDKARSLDGEEEASELRMACGRLLILITKADYALQSGIEAAGQRVSRNLTLRALAYRVDGRRWLRDLLGFDLFSALKAQLRPDAQVAIGLVACNTTSRDDGEEFGIGEALRFLLTGEAQEPVEIPVQEDPSEPWIALDSTVGEPMSGGEPLRKHSVEGDGEVTADSRLFVKAPRSGSAGRVSTLARWLRLDTYSSQLLTKAARREMGLLAVLLLGVGLFELTVWTLLFNSIFHAEVTALSERSLAAVGLGFLFAGVIVYLDRSFVVADPSQKGHKWAASFRIGIVTLSALATSLAVDLILGLRHSVWVVAPVAVPG